MKKYQFNAIEAATLEKLSVPLAVYQLIDKKVETLLISDGMCELFGVHDKADAYRILEQNMYIMTHPEDKARIAEEAFRFANEGGNYEVLYRSMTPDRTKYKIIHAMGRHVYQSDGTRLAYVWYTDEGTYTTEDEGAHQNLSAVLSRALLEDSIVKANYFDYLTGLPGMSYFFELAEQQRRELLDSGKTAAIVFSDFIGMKYYNIKRSFAEGDKLLRLFADIIKGHFGFNSCCRFGSDHFCIIADAEGLEDKLHAVIAELSIANGGKTLPVRMGICLDRQGVAAISADCDRAKYACDSRGSLYRSGFSYFDRSMLDRVENTQYIIGNLDRAIREGWIQTYFQPIVRVANGRVCNEEALARWIDPVKGMLSPGEFIPILEEARLLYKLDLHIVECVIRKMKSQRARGLYVVPVSVNLSRDDFESCDIVDEICRRVDDAGIAHDMLVIEVTESTLGRDYEFMKAQLGRFRELGFRVWMDDFGSEYSSLDVLRDVTFDLIKFDMRFMKEFRQSPKSRIMLNELIRMAIALDVDTVCEGVETKEQVDFLREVGCTMMQGFYYCRPISQEEVMARYDEGIQIGFENPAETNYYAALGKINLYDLATVSYEDAESLSRYFNTLPMAVYEANADWYKLVRCNNTYRSFMMNLFGVLPLDKEIPYEKGERSDVTPQHSFLHALRKCGNSGNKMLVNEELANGTVVHAFLRKIAVNPVKEIKAIAVAVLAVTDKENAAMSFARIAKALSSDYIYLFYVDLNTENYIVFTPNPAQIELSVETHGEHFFATRRSNASKRVYSEDLARFLSNFTKENIIRDIDTQGAFLMSYRQLIDGVPIYTSLKAVRLNDDSDKIIIGVSNVDAQMRQKEALERLEDEQRNYSRISALAGDFLCLYSVDPVTNRYREYSEGSAAQELGVPGKGADFFADFSACSSGRIAPEDRERFFSEWSKEKILSEIDEYGIFVMNYRMLFRGTMTYVSLKAALVEEAGSSQLIIGITNTDARVKRENAFAEIHSKRKTQRDK